MSAATLGAPRRAAVVYNPVAGSGGAEALSHRAAERLRAAGFRVEMRATPRRGGAVRSARELATDVERVVVLGGDGTLREVLTGLGDRRRRVEVALVPLGNANVVARELGLPRGADAALDVAVSGVPLRIDLARAQQVRPGPADAEPRELEEGDGDDARGRSVLFLAMLGIGWDATTVRILERLRSTRLGRLWYRLWADSAYVVAGLLAALRIGAPRLSLDVDGRAQPVRYAGLHLCNLRRYGKGMSMAPDAHPRSGVLHFQARRRSFAPWLLWHLVAAQLGRRSPAWISSYGCGQSFRVLGNRSLAVQIDGDWWCEAEALEVEVLPEAALLLVPATEVARLRDARPVAPPYEEPAG